MFAYMAGSFAAGAVIGGYFAYQYGKRVGAKVAQFAANVKQAGSDLTKGL